MKRGPVVVYAGAGSSHSWTWTADLLESRHLFDARFVDEDSLVACLGEGASLAVVAGGDGFEMASALAPKGFAALEAHLRAGGMYIGVCAGAYLPLPSRIAPFDQFNLSTAKIRNITAGPDEAVESSPRTGVRYGACSVVHPVRGEVEVTGGDRRFTAPLYGGPVFREPEEDRVLMRYSSFTPRTVFHVPRDEAAAMMLGHPAVVSSEVGEGSMVLCGPHLEHPGHPGANDEFVRLAGFRIETSTRPRRTASGKADPALLKALSDMKVAALGMERETFIVGSKLWDAGRMLELAEAVARRASSLDADTAREVASMVDSARGELLSLGPGRVAYTDSAPAMMVGAARLAVDRHFAALRG